LGVSIGCVSLTCGYIPKVGISIGYFSVTCIYRPKFGFVCWATLF